MRTNDKMSQSAVAVNSANVVVRVNDIRNNGGNYKWQQNKIALITDFFTSDEFTTEFPDADVEIIVNADEVSPRLRLGDFVVSPKNLKPFKAKSNADMYWQMVEMCVCMAVMVRDLENEFYPFPAIKREWTEEYLTEYFGFPVSWDDIFEEAPSLEETPSLEEYPVEESLTMEDIAVFNQRVRDALDAGYDEFREMLKDSVEDNENTFGLWEYMDSLQGDLEKFFAEYCVEELNMNYNDAITYYRNGALVEWIWTETEVEEYVEDMECVDCVEYGEALVYAYPANYCVA